MIVKFLGQGLHPEEDETCGNHVCSAINNKSFTQITIFVAFLSKAGLNHLKPFIKKAQKDNRSLIFYAGIDEQVTSKEALELLLHLNIETYIYYSDSYIYHPKIYLFEGERNRIITGSSNLTKSGLFGNVESSILLDFSKTDKSGLKILNQLKEYYSSFLDFTDPNIELLTSEYLEKLILEEKVTSEESQRKSEFYSTSKKNLKKRGKIPEIADLGNLEITEKNSQKKYNSILKITEAYLQKWDYMFHKLESYYQENRHSTIPKDYKDKTLYGWYVKQKKLHKAGIIPKLHLEKLKTINFFFGDAHILYWEKKWLNSYGQLLEVYNKTGDSNIKRYKDNTHPLFYISNWVALERGKYKKGKLKDWQIEKLENIGFQWEMNRLPSIKRAEDDWLEKLELLDQYKNEFGDCNISQSNKNPKYNGLGKWINVQRFNYKKKLNVLTIERIELLEEVGIIWDMDVFNFDKIIQELIEFKNINGHFNIPSNYKSNPRLGNYVYKIKTKGIKEVWKKNKLLEIGFLEIGTKNKKEKKGHITLSWLNNLNKLKKINNPNLTKDDKKHPKLATWLDNQKRTYRYGRLKEEQINELKKLNIQLPERSNKRKKWEEYIEIIELFREEFGNKRITKDFDNELYRWINQQKTNHRKESLKSEKVNKLIELGIIESN